MKKKLSKSSHYDDEAALIKQLLLGDPHAFEYLVAEYHNLMLSVARAIVGDRFADEVVQDAWVSAIKALPKFEGRASLKTWLVQITSNGAKSRVRRENRYTQLDEHWEASDTLEFDSTGHHVSPVQNWETLTPETALANTQLQALIEEAFQDLPAQQRAVMTMIDIENYKITEVCNILDISSSNARVLLHRARLAMHECIKQYQET